MQRFNFQILWFGLFWCFALGFFFFQTSHLLTKLSSWENKHWNFPKEVNPWRVGRDPENPTALVAKGVWGWGREG